MKPMAARLPPPVAHRLPYVSRAGGFAHLVQATVRLGRARREAETRTEEPPLHIWARIVPPIGKGGSTLHRADWLTPYAAESIAADALRAGRGARLDVTVAASATVADLAGVREQFVRLVNQAVKVSVRHDDQPRAQRVRLDRSVAPALPEQLDLPFRAGRQVSLDCRRRP